MLEYQVLWGLCNDTHTHNAEYLQQKDTRNLTGPHEALNFNENTEETHSFIDVLLSACILRDVFTRVYMVLLYVLSSQIIMHTCTSTVRELSTGLSYETAGKNTPEMRHSSTCEHGDYSQ